MDMFLLVLLAAVLWQPIVEVCFAVPLLALKETMRQRRCRKWWDEYRSRS